MLSDDQIEAYERDGYVLVSGLIPDDIAGLAADAVWEGMGAGPDDPGSWPDRYAENHKQVEIVACYTESFLGAAAQLCGDPVDTVRAPKGATAITIFPTSEEWTPPRPHIDHAIKDHGHKTFPRPFRVATMTFLSDVEMQGGGTAVWPGSQYQIEALARSDEAHYAYMWVLNQELDQAGLGDAVVTQPKRGDVLFYSYLCAHAGSKNTSSRPRPALNYKW
jgi:ectoine hydroxylase-related dioxygenase (phytanoyl-CoA dioxygenase family)